jgi:hypothetical protein
MTVSLKHTFQSAKTDSADATLIQPSNWNEEHELTLATNKVLGRATAGTGAAEELSVGTALSVSGGTLAVTNVPVANGGTGASTLTGYVKGNGTSAFTAAATVPAGDVSGTLGVANGGTGAATLTANNVLLGNGTSAVQTVAPGASGNVLISNGTTWTSAASPVSGSLDAVATGSLSNGSTVVINTDGTVSVVAPVITPVPSAGTAVNVASGSTTGVSAAYDSVNQKVVVAYSDTGGPFGRAQVGTVSGTTITFGSVATFASLISVGATSCVYDPNTQKIVIAYKDDTNVAGVGIVGTVSGTSISFGTPTNFFGGSGIEPSLQAVYDASVQRVVIAFRDGGNTGKVAVGAVSGTSISFGSTPTFAASANEVSAVYDANAQKVVIAYAGAASLGTAIVGTTSASSMSFGTPVTFNASGTNATSIAYDANAQKVVIAYENGAASNFGTAIVGTVSGTSISFGTPVVFASVATANLSIVYDASVQKTAISYQGTSNFGNAVFGTVSGTSISFGTPVVFDSTATTLTSSASAYNTAAQRVVTAYRISGNARAVVISATTSTPNLTSENFIGFSSAAYTNGQTATIQLVGSVDDAQSGLTPGRSYFVQTDGTLSLTAGSPSVFAGTAVSATKIIVKG